MDLDAAFEQCTDLKTANEETIMENRRLEAEIHNLQIELQSAQSEQTNVALTKEDLEKEVEVLNENKDKYRENIARLQVQLKATNDNYSSLCKEHDAVKEAGRQQEDAHQVLLEGVRSQCEQTQLQLSEALVQIQATQDKLEEKEKQLRLHEPLIQELAELRSQHQAVTTSVEETQKLNDEVIRLQGILESRQIDMSTLESQYDHLKEQHNKVMEENSGLRKAEAKFAGHDNHLQKIHYLEKKQQEINALKKEVCELKMKLHAAYENVAKYKKLAGHFTGSPAKRTPLKSKENALSVSEDIPLKSRENAETTSQDIPIKLKDNAVSASQDVLLKSEKNTVFASQDLQDNITSVAKDTHDNNCSFQS